MGGRANDLQDRAATPRGRAHAGKQTNWHDPDQDFFFKAEFIAELRALTAGPSSQAPNALAIVAKGDEVPSWHERAARDAGAQLKLIQDSDHASSDFDELLPGVLTFFDLTA